MSGSSPLARGLPPPTGAIRASSRIIPARAGFTRNRHRQGTRRAGSSPLARGLLAHLVCHNAKRRIIPARAGFTRIGSTLVRDITDHPRSRGVYGLLPSAPFVQTGSSPLARGLPLSLTAAMTALGIIPARAGFTTGSVDSGSLHSDHPRSRGVYLSTVPIALIATGSSPLARGLPTRPRPPCLPGGIIPARAGFTFRQCQLP